MKKLVAAATLAAATVAVGAGSASAGNGSTFNGACGKTFGQLISAAKSTGTATHPNYAGGVQAIVNNPEALAIHAALLCVD
jgi:hypothetical protein